MRMLDLHAEDAICKTMHYNASQGSSFLQNLRGFLC